MAYERKIERFPIKSKAWQCNAMYKLANIAALIFFLPFFALSSFCHVRDGMLSKNGAKAFSANGIERKMFLNVYLCVDVGVADVGTATRLECSVLTPIWAHTRFTHHLLGIMFAASIEQFSDFSIFTHSHTWYFFDGKEKKSVSIASLAKVGCFGEWMVSFMVYWIQSLNGITDNN